MRRFGLPGIAAGLSALLLSGLAAAQDFRGGVRGRVVDADGAVPGAVVRLVEESTTLVRTTVSNRDGEYAFPDVLPGTYAVTAAHEGYKTAERGRLRVATQSFVTVDIALDVGAISETVVVQSPLTPAQRSDASIGTLLDRNAIASLPSAGRNIFYTASETATVLPTGDGRFVRQQDQSNSSLISIGGGPRRDNSYTLDGVPMADVVNRAVFIPSFQAIEEMRVQVSAYDAEVGRTSGGVFNTIARSGSNVWHGDGLYQTRPNAAQARPFFAAMNDLPTTDTEYHLYGGAIGGPIARNRTFFWASSEGYRSHTNRSAVMVLPTEAERRGDFSGSGVTLYDPLTTRPNPSDPSQFIRDPFPGNRIPAGRLNPVAQSLLAYLPLPTDGDLRPAVADLVDAADQATGKVTHRWSERHTTTALFAWYGSTEPDARFFGQPMFTNGADPGDGALVRRVHMLVVNHLWVPGDHTTVQARWGFTSFLDDNRPASFDPSQLGFAPAFLAAVPQLKFPNISVSGYGAGGALLGDRFQSTATYYSRDASVTVSELLGRHTLKAGGDSRVTGVRFLNQGGLGNYLFSRDFTFGPDPNAPAPASGDAFASFLLGSPSSGIISTSTPIDAYLRYWSAFVQDEARLTPKLTLNLGLRYEFEQGLEERDDHLSVGWNNGLIYAGVNGAPTHQGDPNPWQFGPRAGVAYAADERTVLRGGYGLFWAPMQGISADEFGTGTRGYNQTTDYVATGGTPFVPCATCSLTNPFPSGFDAPVGNALGARTGVGGTIGFVDPRSHQAHFHRYSVELQRELANRLIVAAAYVGMQGRDLIGGSGGGALNINQLDPTYLSMGTALQTPVANPFAGTALGIGILSAPTVPQGQLLRPYPQFDAVYMLRSSVASSRYDAMVVTAERRLNGGWSARADYTWSRALDSQYGESNFFAGGSSILNNYDVAREYGLSVLDTPHRANLTATIELPFGSGHRWLSHAGWASAIAGGWTISAVGSARSGFPITVDQSPNNSNLLGSGQRPNVVPGVDPLLTNDPSRAYDASCGCIRYLNPAAWSPAAAFTFGNTPRTDSRVRTPSRRNLDLAIDRVLRVGGRTVALRAELVNAFNSADFVGPDIAAGSATFGQIRDTGGFPRMLQLSIKTSW